MSFLAATGFSKNTDSFRAGLESAAMALEEINAPDVIILYASIYHNHEMVLKGVREIIKETPLIGCSAFGEMTNYGMNDNSVALVAIKSDTMKFSMGLGEDSESDSENAGRIAAQQAIEKMESGRAPVGIFFPEMLGGTKALDGIQNVLTNGTSLFGGCCSGNRKVPISNPEFTKGYQYFNDRIYQHSVPLLLLSGDFKYSFGVGHGWRPLGKTVQVENARENTIYELDNTRAFDFYKRYLGDSSFVPYPLGFYHNDHLLLRAVTGQTDNGGLNFTTDIASGTDVRITIGSRANIFKSSRETAQQVLDNLVDARPRLAIVSSCISRRKMLGAGVYKELQVIQEVLGKDVPLIGGYCAGEFAPVSETNFYHNFSFCICLLGEKISEKQQDLTINISDKPKSKKEKIFVATANDDLLSDCREALTELEFDIEPIQDDNKIEDAIRKHAPKIVLLKTESSPLIPKIKQTDRDIQIILIVEQQHRESFRQLLRESFNDISGFCCRPFQADCLKFQVQKALDINMISQENRKLARQLAETQESLDNAEEQIEITEKVVMESYKEIESAHDYTGNIISSMMDSLVVTNPQGKITSLNNAVLDLLGYDKAELAGKDFCLLLPDEFKEEAATLINRDKATNLETFFVSITGKEIPVLLSSSAMKDNDGNITAIVFTAKDITLQKQTENELKDTLAKLEEVNQNLKDFVYIASHDLREPLRKISSFGEILQESLADKISGDDSENFCFMIDGARRMTQMIEGLMSYSRVNTKQQPVKSVDLVQLIDQLKSLELSMLIDEKNVILDVLDDPNAVLVDPVQIRQLLQNLIANAIKYQPKDNTPHITVTTELVDNNMIKVKIADNGIGIKPENLDAVFGMFRRLHSKQEYEGTGIGLAICKKIVKRHGGNIGVESEFGNGSTFWFTVPAATHQPAAVASSI